MENHNRQYNRRSIRLKNYDYSKPGAYFNTICSHDRKCLFGKNIDGVMHLNKFGEITRQCWLDIPNHFHRPQLDEFVIMPIHIHGIIFIMDNCESYSNNIGVIHELPLQQNELPQLIQRRKMLLPKIIGRFKMNVGKQINQIRQTPGAPVWQRNYYENIIRNDDELNKIRGYIINNPLNWELDENYVTN